MRPDCNYQQKAGKVDQVCFKGGWCRPGDDGDDDDDGADDDDDNDDDDDDDGDDDDDDDNDNDDEDEILRAGRLSNQGAD